MLEKIRNVTDLNAIAFQDYSCLDRSYKTKKKEA